MSVIDRQATLSSIWELILPSGKMAYAPGHKGKARGSVFKLPNEQAYKILKTGITSKAINPVGEFLGINKKLMASYLELDRGTVARLTANDQLLPTHAAENVLRLLELDGQATETFSSEQEATAWLNRPHQMLDGDTPLTAAKTSYGAQRVKDILLAIQYGGVV